MSTPRVSICLPNLNNRSFLEERLATVYAQTLSDWELVVSDNYSEDGAWQLFEAQARREPRMAIAQAPRTGMYENWNNCVRRARGEFVYIATSDDTMAPDCLEKLLAALEAHPECDLAHCSLRAIDETGGISDKQEWWSRRSTFARSSGELLRCAHLRRAPFDGLLHLLGKTVYTSITQLLIRRCLFDRIGLFEARWGSVGDFNWGMRAGLIASTVHVPDTWGGWRIHANQATAAAAIGSAEHFTAIESMIEDALASCEKSLAPHAIRPLSKTRELRDFVTEVARRKNSMRRKAFIMRRLLAGSPAARGYLKAIFSNKLWPELAPDLVRTWLEDARMGPILVRCTAAAISGSSVP